MRKDVGVDGDAQRIEQLVWMLFLKIFDDREKELELIARQLQVAAPAAPALARLGRGRRRASPATRCSTSSTTRCFPSSRRCTGGADKIAGLDPQGLRGRLQLHEERHVAAAGDQQDQRHRLQRLGRPPPVRRHLREDPARPAVRRQRGRVLHAARRHAVHGRAGRSRSSGETILDPACGTGGFLACAIEHLRKQAQDARPTSARIQDCIRGVEKKPLPHLLCITNMLLHGIDVPIQRPARQHAGAPAARLRARRTAWT